MYEEEVYNMLERDLEEERRQLKRKLCDADFESVESLKGLDIVSDTDPFDSTGGSSDSMDGNYFSTGARLPPWRGGNGHGNKYQATRPRDIAGSEGKGGRMRSISLTQGPSLDMLQKPKKLPTVFKWERGGKQVFISGSYDNWKSKTPLAKSHGDFYTIIDLPEGTHQYKFHVDGQWVCDPSEPTVDNDLGSENNTMVVKGSDFEVFEALAMDSASTGHSKTGVSHSPPGEYGHNIPPRSQGLGYHSGPPILPPHLLQVILNKEIPLHCEPTLLPEPNHVMLNHLYALSIKDGVMVLSSTHRYRKKYVTTLLYKPIS